MLRRIIYNRLILYERILGFDDIKLGLELKLLVDLYIEMDKLDDALLYAYRSKEIILSKLGKKSKHFDAIQSYIGLILEKLGEDDKALKIFEETLKSTKSILGVTHPWYFFRVDNYKNQLIKMKRYGEAEQYVISSNELIINQIKNVFEFSNEVRKQHFLDSRKWDFQRNYSFLENSNFPRL